MFVGNFDIAASCYNEYTWCLLGYHTTFYMASISDRIFDHGASNDIFIDYPDWPSKCKGK